MILQNSLPYDPFDQPRLPGVRPLAFADWLQVDDAYAAQMAERARLLATHGRDVLDRVPGSEAAETEALEVILEHLPPGFARDGATVTCPDGRRVDIGDDAPLNVLARILQEDIVLMWRPDGAAEHILLAACLCFPASWRLAEKIGRPLIGIHEPVEEYDADLARRVQRLFDGLQPGRPLWRFNALWYADPTLYQPRSADTPRPAQDPAQAPYFRSEKQSLVRLPQTGAVIFSIHTYVLTRDAVLAQRRTARS